MNIIPSANQGGVLALNAFTVRPEFQDALIDCIRDAAPGADVPGLLSMHLLRSTDGTQVINHMQWESEQAFNDAVATNPAIAEAMQQVQSLTEGIYAYEVVDVRH